jgi:hypothetical protein
LNLCGIEVSERTLLGVYGFWVVFTDTCWAHGCRSFHIAVDGRSIDGQRSGTRQTVMAFGDPDKPATNPGISLWLRQAGKRYDGQ